MYYERLVSHDLILAMKEQGHKPRAAKVEKLHRPGLPPGRRAIDDPRPAPSYSSSLFTLDEWAAIVATIGFSPRKAEIAALLLKEFKDEDIARTLGVRKSTVRTHLSQMLIQLEVGSRLGLAVKIFETFRRVVERSPRPV